VQNESFQFYTLLPHKVTSQRLGLTSHRLGYTGTEFPPHQGCNNSLAHGIAMGEISYIDTSPEGATLLWMVTHTVTGVTPFQGLIFFGANHPSAMRWANGLVHRLCAEANVMIFIKLHTRQ
jgi:hypothetical protein